MIEIDDATYVSAIWFLSGEGVDWMGVLSRPKDDPDAWRLVYRFRYHASQSSDWEDMGEDRKSWYTATCSGAEDFLLTQVRRAPEELLAAGGPWTGPLDEVRIQAVGMAAFRRALVSKSWAHFGPPTQAEAKA